MADTPTNCGTCGTEVAPDRRQDFFGYCTYGCMKASQDEYEARKQEPQPSMGDGGIFGYRSIL